MYAEVCSLALQGFGAILVRVECDLSSGLPRFDLVGLPGSSVSESRERVRSAIRNCGLAFPVSRITVNLAPADVRKEGPVYDLPILAAVLLASGQLRTDKVRDRLDGSVLLGELSLSGNIRRIKGVLPMLVSARDMGIRRAYIPDGNAAEASVVAGMEVIPVSNIQQLLAHLNGTACIAPVPPAPFRAGTVIRSAGQAEVPDFADVRGQEAAKRALEVAAAGGHNILMVGPPGSGKSMLARRLPGILPDMTYEEALETTKVYSVAGMLTEETSLMSERPFRAPHHTITAAAMSGGGKEARPGEIPLADNGILFLDELPLFGKASLETLRQPLEDSRITIVRAAYSVTYPSSVMLVCAMNPCPCGYFTDPKSPCTCTDSSRHAYLSKVSGPLLDRIDIRIQVAPLESKDLFSGKPGESSADIRARVAAARAVQQERFKGTGIPCNARMTPEQAESCCIMEDGARRLLKQAFQTLRFSARANSRILKTARTIADLDGSEMIMAPHIMEALRYRETAGLT